MCTFALNKFTVVLEIYLTFPDCCQVGNFQKTKFHSSEHMSPYTVQPLQLKYIQLFTQLKNISLNQCKTNLINDFSVIVLISGN